MSERLSNIVRTDERLAPTAALHVEVIADFVDPFCFLGKRRLDAALRAVQGPTDLSWHPWQLNPEIPVGGTPYHDFLTRRFGSPANIQPILDSLMLEGRAEGIDFRFDRLSRVPNTLRAHQVMFLAETEGKDQTALADELMSAFFERGEDIGDIEVLARLASRHGLASKDVVRAIEDDVTKQNVLSREGQVRSSGITGVPGFLLNRRLLVVGAQDTDAIINAFDRAMFGEGTDELVSPALH